MSGSSNTSIRLVLARAGVAIVAAAATLGYLPAVARASGVRSAGAMIGTPPANDWPQFHHDPGQSGTSPDDMIGAASATSLGVRWMANSTSPIYDSPVVAWNAVVGKTLVYVGDEAGYMTAFDQATGAAVWSVFLGSAVHSTPLVENGNLWVSDTYNPYLFKLDASTGATQCTAKLVSVIDSSPTLATPPGGKPTIYIGANDYGTSSGPMYAIDEAACSTDFAFTGYHQVTGSWDDVAYGIDAASRPTIVFGTADPDSEVYAVDAATGALHWRFATYNPGTKADVGAGAAISPPGANGFADGVAYIPGKDGILYALDLTTGAQIWQYNFGGQSISTPALTGTDLVFGSSSGMYKLNAVTGALIWSYSDPSQILSAPSVVGAADDQVVVAGDLAGKLLVLSEATGALVYSYHTSGYIPGSVADVDGNLLVGSSDGFLYDFALDGGNSAQPTTAITAPVNGSIAPDPGATFDITGSASTIDGVGAVNVAVQEGGSAGSWWDAATSTWVSGPVDNAATLASAGATSSGWDLQVPVPSAGTTIHVVSSAVDISGVADTTGNGSSNPTAASTATVAASPMAATLTVSQSRIAPGKSAVIAGAGYQPNESVTISLPTNPVTVLASVVATSAGTLPSTTTTIPASTPFGPESMTASGASSGATGSSPIIVSNNWSQWRAGPTRTGLESNDPVLNQTTAISENTYLGEAWGLPTGASINSSPAVSNGIAYVANDAGSITAVDVARGAPLWTASVGSTVVSSPAVDAGLVIFGTLSGTVEALSAATGAPAWSFQTGGSVVSSPAVAAGIVYIGSNDGRLYAVSETTGKVAWSYTMTGPVESSPAIDTAHRTLVVGDDGGAVTALTLPTGKAVTGTLKWSDQTGSPVHATPMVVATSVYVGSESGTFYALAEATGATQWTYATGGPIDASAGELNKTIVVGSGDGTVYYLAAATGKRSNSIPLGSPVVGVSTALAFALVETAGGSAYGLRPTGDITNWKWKSSSGLSTAPTVVNGTIYIAGQDQVLHVFAPPGRTVF